MGRRIFGWLGVLWALPVSLLAFVLVLLLRPKWLGGGVRWARVRYGETTALAVWGGALDGLLRRMPLGGGGWRDARACGFISEGLENAGDRCA